MRLVFVLLFLDFLAYAAVIPIVPLIILNTPHTILPPSFPEASRYLLLGSLLSAYPFGQILASPFLGFFADEISRKRVFLISYLGNSAGYFLFGLGVYWSSLPFLFLGNFLSGITGGNLSTTHTFIADHKPKLRFYSLSHLAIGLAFVLGPLCSSLFFSQTRSLPFFCCSAIAFANFLFIYFFLREPDRSIPVPSLREVFGHFKQLMFGRPDLRRLFVSLLLFFFGWYFFIKVFQVLLLHQAHFQEKGFFQILSYFGFCCVATQAVFSLFLYRFLRPTKIIPLCLILLAASLFSFLFVHTFLAALISVTFFSIAYSLLCPAFISVISDLGSMESQGKLMAMHQGIQALAKVLGPLFAAATMAIAPTTPIWVSCLSVLGSYALFLKFFTRRSDQHALENERVPLQTEMDSSENPHERF